MVELYMLLLRYCLGRKMGFNDFSMVGLSKFGSWRKFIHFIFLVNSRPVLILAVNEFIVIIREDVIEYEL